MAYHLCELTYGKDTCYTITNSITSLVERFSLVGVEVKSLCHHPDAGPIKVVWTTLCKKASEDYPQSKPKLLVDDTVYTDIYEAVCALDRVGPRVLGWRVRRAGRRLGLLGGYLRRKRHARRARRQERRAVRRARRSERRVARKARRKELYHKVLGWFFKGK